MQHCVVMGESVGIDETSGTEIDLVLTLNQTTKL